ncbi:MAG: hypothetical protein ACI977_000015 [Candidatus Nanohaloarchaea archaeon]
MEFREGNWANLVYISSFVYPKTQEEVAENWNMKEPEKVLSPTVKAELERLTQVRIMKHEGEGYKAKLDSQAFQTEIKTFLSSHDKWAKPENFKKYLEYLGKDHNREELLNADRIRHYYSNEPEEAINNPVTIFAETIEMMQKIDSGKPVDDSHNAKLAAAVSEYYGE